VRAAFPSIRRIVSHPEPIRTAAAA
jgi:hypothetical protein